MSVRLVVRLIWNPCIHIWICICICICNCICIYVCGLGGAVGLIRDPCYSPPYLHLGAATIKLLWHQHQKCGKNALSPPLCIIGCMRSCRVGWKIWLQLIIPEHSFAFSAFTLLAWYNHHKKINVAQNLPWYYSLFLWWVGGGGRGGAD